MTKRAKTSTRRQREEVWRPSLPDNCAIAEYTADKNALGRCYHHLVDGGCPRHGDVREEQAAYVKNGVLTRDFELRAKQAGSR